MRICSIEITKSNKSQAVKLNLSNYKIVLLKITVLVPNQINYLHL